jgi:WD40 repeat protein/serine/threonine protein kinase
MTALEDQARSLFLSALERAPDRWPEFLEAACGVDADVRARVEQLLRAHREMGSIRVGGGPADTVVESAVAEGPGTVIGPYQLLEPIGEGGFGVVFLAEQTQPVRRKVALKVLKPGMDTRQVVARFEAERQALAIMDHPHIAKVLDGGATPSGRPYFVMELVKGVPITEFCDQDRLTPRQRLELFIPVCQAVQHAHQKGIIHRDLKPSNVLVSRHDTTPAVKVIDFGVAKALGQALTDKTLVTGVAQMIGTPLYMSPEQAGLSDLDVDTRSDVYSLGVLLYELLTGTTPFPKARFQEAGYDEIRRVLREEDPPKPSTRLSESQDTLPAISARRQTEPAKLARLVKGELDWIVMKCLEKDRDRRYESASALVADVERFLAGQPIRARRVGAWERLWRWCRRNPAVASLTAAVFVLLLAGTGISTYFAIQADAKAADEKAAAARARRLQYDADMQLAAQLWEGEGGSAAAVRDLLLAHVPRDGREELREFAWRYQWRLLRDGAPTFRGHLGGGTTNGARGRLVTLPGNVAVAVAPDGHLVTLDDDHVLRHWDHARRCPTRTEDFRHLGDNVPLGDIMLQALSADGRTLAVALRDGSVHRVDLATGRATPLLQGLPPVAGLAFAPGGRVLAAVGGDARARLWEVATGREVWTTKLAEVGLKSLALSPDGSALLVAGLPDDFDVTTLRAGGEPVRRHYDPSSNSLAYSPDGRLEAFGLATGEVVVWDVPAGKERWRWNAQDSSVSRLEFSPDGRRLATGGVDGLVAVWDVASRERPPLRTYRGKGHTAAVTSLAFAADGATLASGSADGTAKLWDLTAAAEGRPLAPALLQGNVAYSPDGRWLATAGRAGARLWDARTGRPVRALPVKDVTCLAFSPDSRTLATGGANHPVPPAGEPDFLVRLWDVATGGPLGEFQGPSHGDAHQRAVGSLAFSPDGRLLAAGFGNPLIFVSPKYDQVVKVWDVRSAREVKTLPVPSTVPALAFSPDGQTLAAACRDGTLRRWAVATWQERRPLLGGSQLQCVAFSPDGRTLAVGAGTDSLTGGVHLWDVATGREMPPLAWHSHVITALAFAPDGKTLASGSIDRTVRLWDVASGRALRTLRGQADVIVSAAFSPDGTTLATGSNFETVRLWEAASPQAIAADVVEDRIFEERHKAFSRTANGAEHWRALFATEDYRRAGFLQDWLILAPIPLAVGQTGADGVDREQHPDEAQLRPQVGDSVAGQELVWRKYRAENAFIDFNAFLGFIDFKAFLGRTYERNVAYAACYVHSDADRADLELRVGSDDQAKVYLNGTEVYKSLRPRRLVLDQDSVRVSLRRGTNVLVFKVVNEQGAWQGCLRFVDLQGLPAQGLRVSATPER